MRKTIFVILVFAGSFVGLLLAFELIGLMMDLFGVEAIMALAFALVITFLYYISTRKN